MAKDFKERFQPHKEDEEQIIKWIIEFLSISEVSRLAEGYCIEAMCFRSVSYIA